MRYIDIYLFSKKCLPTLHKDLDLNTHLVASLILQPALKPMLQSLKASLYQHIKQANHEIHPKV